MWWRDIGRLEVGEIEVARWLNTSLSVIHKLWQQFQNPELASRFSQGQSCSTTSVDDQYFSFCARRKGQKRKKRGKKKEKKEIKDVGSSTCPLDAWLNGVSTGGCTGLHVFLRRHVTDHTYRDDILDAYMHPYPGTTGNDDKTRPHRARIVDDYFELEVIQHMQRPSRSPDRSPIKHI
ncbi:transposable element Tcb1 transposase [Trichonephila clavipes]|nr:transposable element Tcb1 transposase [Trichonephila clavipes]